MPNATTRREHSIVHNCININHVHIVLNCLSIGTPKTINFPFVPNGKLMVLRCPNNQEHDNEAEMSLNFGTPKNNFPFGTNGKLLFIGVPILSTLWY